jgi:hypothetical protein
VLIVSPAACSLQADCNCQPSRSGVTVSANSVHDTAATAKQQSKARLRMGTRNLSTRYCSIWEDLSANQKLRGLAARRSNIQLS